MKLKRVNQKKIKKNKFFVWLKRLFCTHDWEKYKVHNVPNKYKDDYPSRNMRECSKCNKREFLTLDGRKYI